jgi:hypothetical protein
MVFIMASVFPIRSYEKEKTPRKRKWPIETRPDLQDASKGKDLSYLNEMPQMGGYEGVKAGLPEEDRNAESKKSKNKK